MNGILKKRKLIVDYKNCILEIGKKLSIDNYSIAVDIASTPDQIRGFGHVKEKNRRIAEECRSNLITSFNERDRGFSTKTLVNFKK